MLPAEHRGSSGKDGTFVECRCSVWPGAWAGARPGAFSRRYLPCPGTAHDSRQAGAPRATHAVGPPKGTVGWRGAGWGGRGAASSNATGDAWQGPSTAHYTSAGNTPSPSAARGAHGGQQAIGGAWNAAGGRPSPNGKSPPSPSAARGARQAIGGAGNAAGGRALRNGKCGQQAGANTGAGSNSNNQRGPWTTAGARRSGFWHK